MVVSYPLIPAPKDLIRQIVIMEWIFSSGRDTEVGMSQSSKADVIIAAYPHRAALVDCVDQVLEHSGEHLGRLILFDDNPK